MDIFTEWARALVDLARAHDHLALYVLLTVEEAGVPLPLPGDTVVAYAGYLATQGRMIWWLVLLSAVASSVTGSIPLYWLARAKGRPLLLRYGRYLHLTPARERRIEGWLQRHGGVAVFVGRLVPGLRVGTTALAGTFEIPFWVFLANLTLSAFVWWGFWLWLGSAVGQHLAPMLEFSPLQLAGAVAVVTVIGSIAVHVRRQSAEGRGPALANVESAPKEAGTRER